MRLAAAEWSVARDHGGVAPSDRAVRAVYRRMLRSAFRDALDLGALAVDGDDLRRAGIPSGPRLGKILQALLTAVIDDPSKNTTDWLLQEATRANASLPPDGRSGTRGGSGAGGGSDVRTSD
jgi:tRNA nucleotidyltransferase (CCA-adding enzyme)